MVDQAILYDYQFGFQKSHSTISALIALTDKITPAINREEAMIGVFLDYSKALTIIYYY